MVMSLVRYVMGRARLWSLGWFVIALLLPHERVFGDPVELGTLSVGRRVFHDVVVVSVRPDSLVIRHSKGIAQIWLRDLSPDLQTRFDYDPEAAEAYSVRRREEGTAARQRLKRQRDEWLQQRSDRQSTGGSGLDELAAGFGGSPLVDENRNLLEGDAAVILRDQGRKPSCSVFAVLRALEYAHFRETQKRVVFSEAYTIWSILGSEGSDEQSVELEMTDSEDDDLGLSLAAVFEAVESWGLADSSEVEYRRAGDLEEVSTPSDQTISRAKERFSIERLRLPGTGAEQVRNIIHALNSGRPVVMGCRWPWAPSIRRGYLSDQPVRPGYGHAVTLFGYRKMDQRYGENGQVGVSFYFANSWGLRWGVNGFGWVTGSFLEQHLQEAWVVDLKPRSRL